MRAGGEVRIEGMSPLAVVEPDAALAIDRLRILRRSP